jgi:hypothetical protein
MTDLKQAAQAALEALEYMQASIEGPTPAVDAAMKGSA